MAIVVDFQINVVDGTGNVMSNDVDGVGVEGDRNDDDDNDGDVGCGYDGDTIAMLERSKIDYPWLKQMCHDAAQKLEAIKEY